jgi:magnesium transporter
MLYLSQLLGTPVEDQEGVRIGKISGVMIPAAQVGSSEPAYPSALLVEGEQEQSWRVPTSAVAWQGDALRLRVPLEQLSVQPEEPAVQELNLAQDVLDKQVIDIVHKKAARVNDVCMDDDWRLLGIDNSTVGLLRRLAPAWLLGPKRRRSPTTLIPWEQIELIGTQRLDTEAPPAEEEARVSGQLSRTPSGHLAELRPADIADIVHQLTPGQGARLIEGLDDETAADALEEIDTERQTHILENISLDRAADILEAMGPDEAADLLARLPPERAQELLNLMTPEESEDVQDLLKYEEDTAGGLMTTDYIVIDQAKTVADALEAVRNSIKEDIRAAYVYCVADASRDECVLLGAVSLWDLLVAPPTQPLQELMETDIVTVHPDADPHTVAEIIAKYNLLAVPVVNAEGVLEGIVTVDDALDVLLPPERRRKPTRMY